MSLQSVFKYTSSAVIGLTMSATLAFAQDELYQCPAPHITDEETVLVDEDNGEAVTASEPGAENAEGLRYSLPNLNSHPLAGGEVDLLITGEDGNGQQTSTRTTIFLPMPDLNNPRAPYLQQIRREWTLNPHRAEDIAHCLETYIEQEASRFRNGVTALDLLKLRDDMFVNGRAQNREAMNQYVSELWSIILRMEEDLISDAQRAFNAAQEALREALENEATRELLEELLQQAQEAMDELLQEQMEEAENGALSEEQIEALEDMARAMEQLQELMEELGLDAQEMAELMQQLMENMQPSEGGQPGQSGQPGESQPMTAEQMQQALEQMREQLEQLQRMQELSEALNELIEEQTELNEDTAEQSDEENSDNPSDTGQSQDQGQQSDPGSPGGQAPQTLPQQRPDPNQGQQGGGSGSGQSQPQHPPQSQPQHDETTPERGQEQHGDREPTLEDLRERQDSIQQGLNNLRQELMDEGFDTELLDEADEFMEQAERHLENGELDEAIEDQNAALESLQQAQEQMQQQMQQMMQMMPGPGNGNMSGFSPGTPNDGVSVPDSSVVIDRDGSLIGNPNPDAGGDVEPEDSQAGEIREQIQDAIPDATGDEELQDFLNRLLGEDEPNGP